jgi:hypothetical protein
MNTALPKPGMGIEDLFGKRIAARLSDTGNALPHEVTQRLKAARMLALSKRNVLSPETAGTALSFGASAALHRGGERFGWWGRLAATVPLFALVVGLLAIDLVQDEYWANEIASVDTELLTDELPPAAYTDPGFAQYLRSAGRE